MNYDEVKSRFSIPRIIAAAVATVVVFLYGVAGLSSIEPGEVGVLVKNIGADRGVQAQPLGVGLNWVEPFSYDVKTVDTRIYQYRIEDMMAGTKDGQPVSIDVSLSIGLDAGRVQSLVQNVAADWYEEIVLPKARGTIRTATGSVLSDAIYTGAGRVLVQDAIQADLKGLDSYGIRVEVNVRDIEFTNEDFVNTLEAKAKAAQQEEIQRRLAAASAQEAIKVANIAEGQKQKAIKEAEANREAQRLAGEGKRLRSEEEAKGNLALALAEAKGIEAKNNALEGSGGERMVQLEWARQLGPNVKVYAVPTGSPGTASLLDLNGVLKGAFSGATN